MVQNGCTKLDYHHKTNTMTKADLITNTLKDNSDVRYTIRDLATIADTSNLYVRRVLRCLIANDNVILADTSTKAYQYQWKA